MSSPLLILLVDGLLLLAAGLFGYSGRGALSVSILVVTVPLVVLQWVLFDSLRSTGQTVRIESGLKRPHYTQGILQICLYLYWGLYWDEVWNYAPLIVVQLIFAYAIEMLLSWSRYRVWRVGFGPVPIVLSMNLFLWFKDGYFVFQFALIVLAYLGKDFIRWNRGGQSRHIFNPSAFPLAFVTVGLLATGDLGFSYGVDITAALTLPPNMYEMIFLLGVVIQLLYATTLVTLGAVLSQYLLYSLATFVLGGPPGPILIELSVFLGLTLLVTDPSTSPRTKMGKFLFGVTYGGGAFFIFIGLRLIHQPSFVDKILMVPIVNLLVPLFDRIGETCHRWTDRAVWLPNARFERFAWVVLYTGLFVSLLPRLKNPVESSSPLPPPAGGITRSHNLDQRLINRDYCQRKFPDPFKPFGFPSEIASYWKLREVYQYGEAKFPLPDR